ncbi:MAG: hypothetical protein ACSNEK_00130 [Parachlamydiaceae bacterium]
MNVNFFTPIICSPEITSKKLKSLERIDEYFYFGGRRAEILSANGNQLTYKFIQDVNLPVFTALKIASYCTILIPIVMLTAKAILRQKITFISHEKTIKQKAIRTIQKTYRHFKELKNQNKSLFPKYKLNLKFSSGSTETCLINSTNEQDSFFSKIVSFLDLPGKYVEVTSRKDLEKALSNFQYKKHFVIEKKGGKYFFLPCFKLRYVDFPFKIKRKYRSRIIDEVTIGINYELGSRKFPDGTIEQGGFNLSTHQFLFGLRKTKNHPIEFVHWSFKFHMQNSNEDDEKTFKITSLKELEEFFQFADDYINHHHGWIKITHPRGFRKLILDACQAVPLFNHFECIFLKKGEAEADHCFYIKSKRLNITWLSDCESFHTYYNGVQEHFISSYNIEGERTFPYGKTEMGLFENDALRLGCLKLISGCVIDKTSITFVNSHYQVRELNTSIHIDLSDSQNVKNIITSALQRAHKHESTNLKFVNSIELKHILTIFQRFKKAKKLRFYEQGSELTIRPKPIHEFTDADGYEHSEFSNGVKEQLQVKHDPRSGSKYYEGRRVFPNGKREEGKFTSSREFESGLITKEDGSLIFYRPSYLVSIKLGDYYFEVIEFNDNLLLLEVNKTNSDYLTISTRTILSILLENNNYDQSWFSVLSHTLFQAELVAYVEKLTTLDPSGQLPIFQLSETALLTLVTAIKKSNTINIYPLKLINPQSGKNLLMHVAQLSTFGTDLLETLSETYPNDFVTCGLEIIHELFSKDFHRIFIIIGIYKKLGGQLDHFTELCIEATSFVRKKHTQEFKSKLSKLTIEQQKFIYTAAFHHNNPYLFELADRKITPQEYSLNFLWINKTPLSKEKTIFFGKGATEEDAQLDFYKKFILPIAKWIRKNPETPANIWIDSEMTPLEVVDRVNSFLQEELNGASHSGICFKDIRSLEVVQQNPDAFHAKIPVYLRVDLGKAIVADHAMRNRHHQYFVLADLDVTPISRKNLFDKRTLEFLDDYGFVMAKRGGFFYENSFQIFNSSNEQLIQSHRRVIIDSTIDWVLKCPGKINEQQIYDTYVPMLAHFFHHDGRFGKIKNISDENQYFRHFDTYGIFITDSHSIDVRSMMPTKVVQMPTSHFFSNTKNDYDSD